MRTVMVRYKVKGDRVEENVRKIQAVFAELERARPEGVHYASFRLADGVSFVHLARFEKGGNPLGALESFERFSSDIRERCDEPPASVELEAVGVFSMFGGRA